MPKPPRIIVRAPSAVKGHALVPADDGVTRPRLVEARKGRGAVSNMQGRYDRQDREAFDDGWSDREGEDGGGETGRDTEGTDACPRALADTGTDPAGDVADIDPPPPLHTLVTDEQARTILTRNTSPDVPFNVSLNPYRGCEHGCIYCFARPSHSYLNLSPGLDFESRLFAKVNAPELLRRELAHPRYMPEPIALGVNTDAYQPVERERRLTRRILEVLSECQHPVGLITKSSLIERDIDLLAPMAEKRLAAACVTITTLDPAIARTLEPRAAAPARRLRTVRTLSEAGIPVGVSIAPVIPFVTEPDLERVMEAACEAGARNVSYIVLRLPWEVSPLFQEWLQAHFPERAQRVMNRIRDLRGGRDYDAQFGARMQGEGIWADLIRQRFEKAARRLGLGDRGGKFRALDVSQFRRPELVKAAAPDDRQGDLFG